jgi:hypothetical protein
MYTLLRSFNQVPGFRRLWSRFPFGSIDTRIEFGIWPRPHYAYGVYQAADLARRLKLPAVSVVEFGVAGGRGLLELENLAQLIGPHFGVNIAVIGLDNGSGLPAPVDYRDLPYYWHHGYYKMDVEKLKSRLKCATLVLGDVAETLPQLWSAKIAPIGFIAFDLDYYSSTRQALRIFHGPHETRLPRVFCYFDDIMSDLGCFNDYIGELCAIREYNLEEPDAKLCILNGLEWMKAHQAGWQKRIYVQHDFKHPSYCTYITGDAERDKLSL